MAAPVYWIGNNGNIYYGSGQAGAPVQDLGSATNGQFETRADGLYDKFTDNGVPKKIFAASQIDNPSGSGGHTLAANTVADGTPPKVLNQGGVDNTQKTIDEIPGLLHDALAAENTSFGNVKSGFDASQGVQQGAHDTGTVTNQQNYDANFMDSIRAGIKGLAGVMALLRGTGASGGTAEDLARDTVGGVTSSDIRGGADTQKENQGQLDSSLSTFLTDLKQKRQLAEDTHTNNARAITRDSNTQLQDLFGKMAGFYGDVGDTASADSWMNKAGGLTPEISRDSRTAVSKYDTTPVVIHAPNLTAFSGASQPDVIAPPSDGQVGSGIFTMDPRRKRDVATPPVAVPAGV